MTKIEIALSAATTIIGILWTVLTFAARTSLRRLDEKDTANEVAITTFKAEINDRLTALHGDVKSDREKFDRRLSDIERAYISRSELMATIRDIRDGFDRGVERIEASFKQLNENVNHLLDRVAKVEARN